MDNAEDRRVKQYRFIPHTEPKMKLQVLTERKYNNSVLEILAKTRINNKAKSAIG